MNDGKEQKLILETVKSMLTIQLNSVNQLLGKEKIALLPVRRHHKKRKYIIDYIVEILNSKQRPMHVDEIVDQLEKQFGRITDRDSLASVLAKKAKQEILVRRVGPATFDLKKTIR